MTPLTLIQMDDLHGHRLPSPNLRSDGTGREKGGLARLYAKIGQIRAGAAHALPINTDDIIQGSAEALHTRGQALVEVVNRFDVAAFAPGNLGLSLPRRAPRAWRSAVLQSEGRWHRLPSA